MEARRRSPAHRQLAGVVVRAARPGDAGTLSDLALRSKGHWGYDAEFLEACRAELTLTAADVDRLLAFVAEDGGEIAGFYAIEGEPPEGELTHLFVDPVRIGSGLGKKLWSHAMGAARDAGFETLLIESEPYAEPFYAAMGAVRFSERPSGSITGRKLPLMRIKVG